jgi:hypothetical protein
MSKKIIKLNPEESTTESVIENRDMFDYSREYVSVSYYEIKEAKALGARFDNKKNMYYVSKSNLELFLLKFTNLTKAERRYVYLIQELKHLFDELILGDNVAEIKASISEKKKEFKNLKVVIDRDMDIEYYISMEEHIIRRKMKNSNIHF